MVKEALKVPTETFNNQLAYQNGEQAKTVTESKKNMKHLFLQITSNITARSLLSTGNKKVLFYNVSGYL